MTELYIEDFRTLDEILDFAHEQIITIHKDFHMPKPKGLKKELESLLKKEFPNVIEQYGLKDGDELPDVLANRIIHELFSNCVRSAYLLWMEENWEDINEESPFAAVDINKTYSMLEKQYAKDGVALDAEAMVHELKRGLQYVLFDGLSVMREIVMDEDLILDIQAKGNLPSEEVSKRLKEELVNAKELVK